MTPHLNPPSRSSLPFKPIHPASALILAAVFLLGSPAFAANKDMVQLQTQVQQLQDQQEKLVASQQLALQELENLRQQQASSLAYFDSFWMIAVLTFAVAFLVLLMKRSVAEKGAHLAQSE